MATIKDLKSWIEQDIVRFGQSKTHIEIIGDSNPCYFFEFRFYTDNNRYTIIARNYPDEKTYLGCMASNRKTRAGEDWYRGSDLADGDLSSKTWHRILGDIISYEMVKIHKDKGISVPAPTI